jgi:hypothetical protein
MGNEPQVPLIYNDYLKVYRIGIFILLVGILLFISVFIWQIINGDTEGWFGYLYVSIILLALVPLLYLFLYLDRFHLYDDYILLPKKEGIPPRPQRLYKDNIESVIIYDNAMLFRRKRGMDTAISVTPADKIAFRFYFNRNSIDFSEKDEKYRKGI